MALIVDDDRHVRESLREILELDGYVTLEAGDGRTALDILSARAVDVLILDLELPRISGLDVLRQVTDSHLDLCAVIISGYGSVARAVATMKLGAYDFIEKPLSAEQTLLVLRNALDHLQHRRARERSLAEAFTRYGMIGSSQAMAAVYESIDRAATSRAKVLLLGETGTGKELVARAVHRTSRRASGPFVPLNCAAVPETLIESELFGHARGAFTGAIGTRRGVFEQAHRGTLFLDEIGEMSLIMQAKLLRAIEDGHVLRVGSESPVTVDCRVIAATHHDLEAEVRAGNFREDLFYRLSVLTIHVPPLRQRREDIPEIITHYLRSFCEEQGRNVPALSASAVAALVSHDWPGNVRELRNAAERLSLHSGDGPLDAPHVRAAIRHRHMTTETAGVSGLREARDGFEREYIMRVLADHQNRIQDAARTLGINRSHLWRKIKRLDIHAGRDAEPPES